MMRALPFGVMTWVWPERISKCDDADNFWSMGATGPCGPCTEIFMTTAFICRWPTGTPEQDYLRRKWFSIRTIVISKGIDTAAVPCVDTGMGLERISAVMPGTLIMRNTEFQALADIIKPYLTEKEAVHLADHCRSCACVHCFNR